MICGRTKHEVLVSATDTISGILPETFVKKTTTLCDGHGSGVSRCSDQ